MNTGRERNVGVVSIGLHLPPTTRTNDWWPKSTVQRWIEKTPKVRAAMREALERLDSPGQRAALQAGIDELDDPFRGAQRRHVLDPQGSTAEMEAAAARDALARANLGPEQVDMVLQYSLAGDFLATNNACSVQHMTGMRKDVFALQIDGGCNSFLMGCTIACNAILAGKAKYVMLVQSTAPSRVLAYDDPYSAWFGDAASAVIVGPVPAGRGILSDQHRSDGSMQGTLVLGRRGEKWFRSLETPQLYSEYQDRAQRMFVMVPDLQVQVANDALSSAGIRPEQVHFFACHQAKLWLRSVIQELCGLSNAKALDLFANYGSLAACNVPFVLGLAQREGMLRDGDLVLLSSGGSGITYSAMVLTWAA